MQIKILEKSRADLLMLILIFQTNEEGYCCYPWNNGTLPCVCICIFFPFYATSVELKTAYIVTIK
jgi:hypothetical protein